MVARSPIFSYIQIDVSVEVNNTTYNLDWERDRVFDATVAKVLRDLVRRVRR